MGSTGTLFPYPTAACGGRPGQSALLIVMVEPPFSLHPLPRRGCPPVSQPSPSLGLQLLAPALTGKMLECIPALGQDHLLLGLGLLLSHSCPGLAPGLKLPQCFLGRGNTEATAPAHAPVHIEADLSLERVPLDQCHLLGIPLQTVCRQPKRSKAQPWGPLEPVWGCRSVWACGPPPTPRSTFPLSL